MFFFKLAKIAPIALGFALLASCGKGESDVPSDIRERQEIVVIDAIEVSEERWETVGEIEVGLFSGNEEAVLRALGKPREGIDYESIGELLIRYYRALGIEKGLAAFKYIGENPSLSAPILGRMLLIYSEENDLETAVSWLVAHQHYYGAENAALILGELAGAQNVDGEGGQVFDSAFSIPMKDGLKEGYLLGLVRGWLKVDFNGVFEHLREQEASPLLDGIYYQLVAEAAWSDPVAAMLWAQQISDVELHQSAIIDAAHRWIKNGNADGYAKWKKEANLAPDILAELP